MSQRPKKRDAYVVYSFIQLFISYVLFLLYSVLKFMDTFEMLVRNGADFNQQDENGFTTLHHAVAQGNVEAATFMIESNMVDFEVNI
jgi:ankyrin repeat protein